MTADLIESRLFSIYEMNADVVQVAEIGGRNETDEGIGKHSCQGDTRMHAAQPTRGQ
jgi:hypothetical protein